MSGLRAADNDVLQQEVALRLNGKTLDKVQSADRGARRKAIWVVGVTTLLGGCVIIAFEYFQSDLQDWLARNIGYLVRHPVLVFLVGLAFASPVVVAGIYLLELGSRAVRTRRFPPPGYAVVRDTPVHHGVQAIRRGRIIQLLSLLVMAAAVTLALILAIMFRTLGDAT
jgi:hypothetical protein